MSEIPKNAKKPTDRRSSIKGKVFTWQTEDGDTLTIPLRVKMKTLLELADLNLDAEGMYRTIEAIAPDQTDLIDEMDSNDFTAAFQAWQVAYTGGEDESLGESSSSSN